MKEKSKNVRAGTKVQLTAEELDWNARWEKVVGELEKRKRDAYNWPTVAELAHLAAMMGREGKPRDAKALAAEASAIWWGCTDQLQREIQHRIQEVKDHWDTGFEPEWVRQEWQEEQSKRPRFANGRAKFDDVLTGLMGKKIRLSDRYKAFREFLAAEVQKQFRLRDTKKIANCVEESMVALRKGGFTEAEYNEAEGQFREWTAQRRKAQAKAAAAKRWAEEKKRKKELGAK